MRSAIYLIMAVLSSDRFYAINMLTNLRTTYADVRGSLERVRTLRRLIRLGREGLTKLFHEDGVPIKPNTSLSSDEFLYRSIIYTLFYSNLHSASWILMFERRMEGIAFPYADAELVLRSMLERLIHQHYIMTDPKRLASLFTIWQIIEYKRYYQAIEETMATDPHSIAAIMEGGTTIEPWSAKQEEEYNDAVKEWESLVIPKQSVDKSRSWSGLSIKRMAEIADLADFYKIFYKATSWYSHGLIHVSDVYLHFDPESKRSNYHDRPTREQIKRCIFGATMIYGMSLEFTGDVLGWDIGERLSSIFNENFTLPKYLVELLISFYDRL